MILCSPAGLFEQNVPLAYANNERETKLEIEIEIEIESNSFSHRQKHQTDFH